MENDKKENNGCFSYIVFGVMLLVFWGILGMGRGNGFFESIGESIEALIIIGVLFFAAIGAYNFFK